ncbi:alpha/beta fold hydrolase [Streptomyces sp. NBC_00102]|uniref:alpha/beta hydrolase n=1 Tax=Streptomyces sp. NBC_00102 TaxID=2975652 RepID=UPI0022526FBE|nr:alpha/beta fold hydrolase [Streptomyces sp. NBC_00102]MCX5398121.1 alpha/beta hydrolase [Streptomyces sp. NBC_00102]
MTVFLLVPGTFTGGWIWDRVAGLLEQSGATALTLTLTGLGDGAAPAGPDTGLTTHIEDVVRAVDGVDPADGDVVLVAHDYGILPVLGAAALRPERVSRIVNLDAGLPQDGEPALAIEPDPKVRERALALLAGGTGLAEGRAGGGGSPEGARLIPPPSAEEWRRRAGSADLSAEDVELLARRAVPHPAGTLVEPLPPTGAAVGVPYTGVLASGNGSTLDLIESLVGMGEPRVQTLTRPEVTLFEIPTGHWPMLSAPADVADLLRRAVAGEGHRVAARAGSPQQLGPFLLDVPERERERHGLVDLYYPDAETPRPAVLFVHGGPVDRDASPTPRDWPTFVGYGRYVASLGAVGAVLDHRLFGLGAYPAAAEDLAEAVERVRADPRVDGDRVAVWFFSAGSLLCADLLADPPSFLRCVAATYPMLAPLANWPQTEGRFRPAEAVGTAGPLPFVLSRVEKERPEIDATVEEFLLAAKGTDLRLEVIPVPGARHGFEAVDHTDPARRAVREAVRTVLGHLGGVR